MKPTIYHNQNCSKSCAAIDALNKLDTAYEVVEYLETTPSAETLENIISMLGIKPEELVRKNEPVFLEKFEGKTLSDQQWIEAMITYPILIERPIVVFDGKAVIGRPLEKVISLLKD